MYGSHFEFSDVQNYTSEWGGSHIRWQLNWYPQKGVDVYPLSIENYRLWLDEALKSLDRFVKVCDELGVNIIIDLHSPPGGGELFSSRTYINEYLNIWSNLASRYESHSCVKGYDILNEPMEPKLDDIISWRELALEVIDRIQVVNTNKIIVFEPSPGADPSAFVGLVPLDRTGIVYSLHMYIPHEFTHQGIGKWKGEVSYPGVVNGVIIDKKFLIDKLMPVIDFQMKYQTKIYVGEFSVVRWAPNGSSYRYLKDVIDIFELYKWSWVYHAYREWHGWSLEIERDIGDVNRLGSESRRLKLIKHWFSVE